MRAKTARAGNFGDELERIGYRGAEPVGRQKFQAMFELHIEQGPILEAESRMIGIVTGVQGMRWYEVTVKGQEAHTGATPMRLRRNALLGAARMIEAIHQVGMRHLPGRRQRRLIENRPNSRNVVPGEVFFTVDLRHPDEAVLDEMERDCRAALPEIAAAEKLELDEKRIWKSPAVKFDPRLIECVQVRRREIGLHDPRHGLGRRPRCGLYRSCRADDHDLRALPRRPVAQ